MLLIVCPHCGPRNNDEFAFGGEASSRPGADASPDIWRSYLYDRANVAGWQTEQWFHVSGCRRFLNIERNTITNEIRRVRDASEGHD